jgi:hypothetical protein
VRRFRSAPTVRHPLAWPDYLCALLVAPCPHIVGTWANSSPHSLPSTRLQPAPTSRCPSTAGTAVRTRYAAPAGRPLCFRRAQRPHPGHRSWRPPGIACHTLRHAFASTPTRRPDQCRPHVAAAGRPRKYLTPRIGEVKLAARPWPWTASRSRPRRRDAAKVARADGPL